MEFQHYTKQYKDQCLKVFESNIGQYFDASERELYTEYLNALSRDINASYYVYLLHGEVIACGGYLLNVNACALAWGMVHRDFHNKGIGTKLIDFRLGQLSKNKDVKTVLIETSQHTKGFYTQHGFVQTQVIKDGFGKNIDRILMEKVIAHHP